MRMEQAVKPISSDGVTRDREAEPRSLALPRRKFAALAAACLSTSLSLACTAAAGVKPVVSHDSETRCPAGRVAWNLRISDQRANLEDSARVMGVIRESLSGSLPDCRWTATAQPDAGTISIELHKFRATLEGGVYDAGVEWGTWVRDSSGRTLTEFESTGEESRPNYRGEDSERVALQRALEKAMNATLAGLRSLSPGS
jgi:hypothetical protein